MTPHTTTMTGLDYEDADDNYLRANQAKQRLTLETFQKHDVNNDGMFTNGPLSDVYPRS
jgi:hypothetical protein